MFLDKKDVDYLEFYSELDKVVHLRNSRVGREFCVMWVPSLESAVPITVEAFSSLALNPRSWFSETPAS